MKTFHLNQMKVPTPTEHIYELITLKITIKHEHNQYATCTAQYRNNFVIRALMNFPKLNRLRNYLSNGLLRDLCLVSLI